MISPLKKLAASVLFLLCVLVCPGDAQTAKVRVVSAGPEWRLATGQVLSRNSSVDRRAPLSSQQPGGIVLECEASIWLSYTCKSGPCRINACSLEGTNVSVGRAELPVAGSFDFLFRRQPREPVVAASRDGGNPTDAVLMLDASGLHAGPALNRVLEGRYCLKLSPLPGGLTTSLSIGWDRAIDLEGLVQAPGLVPGLYQLEKGPQAQTSACVPDANGSEAWALVTTPSNFERVSAAWKEQAAVATALERAEAARNAVSAVRRAILAGLAETVAP